MARTKATEPKQKCTARKSSSKRVYEPPTSPSAAPIKKAKKSPRRPKKKGKIEREIRRLQSTTNLLIPRAPFVRLVRELTQVKLCFSEIRWKLSAIDALRESAEAYIVGLFTDSYECCRYSKRVTLMCRDLQLASRIRGDVLRVGVPAGR
ncbi:histone H3.3-like isoform 2 [Planoprotostelium fungivorum]|uniref:Histone H3.3-like isoform 2 n=1 Tax=Planoprotostelium fungivorum TaxID=1890364 RepID=A0A2P6N5U7_9EUKA|nr:histone H3.3-like isoform 2 [Planoprotostelium fungivorum]